MTIPEQVCKRVARRYYAPGLELQDLEQEARIAVWRAQRDFNPSRGPWEPFAALAAERGVVSAVRAATRHKHAFVSHAVSLDEPIMDGGDTLAEHLAAPTDIASEYESRERVRGLLAGLSALEAEVVRHRIAGQDFATIAAELGVDEKSVDNALQRVRLKAQRSVEAYDQMAA